MSLRARALGSAGRFDEAIVIMERLCRPDTDSADFRHLLARLRRWKAEAEVLRRVRGLVNPLVRLFPWRQRH